MASPRDELIYSDLSEVEFDSASRSISTNKKRYDLTETKSLAVSRSHSRSHSHSRSASRSHSRSVSRSRSQSVSSMATSHMGSEAQVLPLQKLEKSFQQSIKPLIKDVQNLRDKVYSLSRASGSSSKRSRSRSAHRQRTRYSSSPENKKRRRDSFSMSETEQGVFSEEELDKFVGEETFGRPLKSEVKKHFESYFTKSLQSDSLTNKIKRHPRPENFEKCKVPMTNKPIWDEMKALDRSADVKIRNAQNVIFSGAVAAAKALEKVKDKRISKHLEDAVALIGQASLLLTNARKDVHKRALPFAVRKIVQSEPDQDFLYGPENEVKKNMKELEKESKLEKERRDNFLEQRRRRTFKSGNIFYNKRKAANSFHNHKGQRYHNQSSNNFQRRPGMTKRKNQV